MCTGPHTGAVTFDGWPAEALDFYEHLEADNSKTFWQSHKDRYEQAVREPMERLLDELEPEFGPGRIFRPNRDVRFSADKSPYKTHIGAHLAAGGYVQLSADGLACGNGLYRLAPTSWTATGPRSPRTSPAPSWNGWPPRSAGPAPRWSAGTP